MMYWLVDGFLVPLLQSAFYVTDSTAFRNRTLYFRQDDWAVITKPLLDNLISTTFKELDEPVIDPDQQVARVRLMPKAVGVRPIVNLRKTSKTVRCAGYVLSSPPRPTSATSRPFSTARVCVSYDVNSLNSRRRSIASVLRCRAWTSCTVVCWRSSDR